MWLEEDFDRKLSDAWIGRLPGPECTEGAAAQLIEIADLIGAVDGTGADAFRRKVRVVEDVEVLGAELNLPAFGDQNVFGDLGIPVGGVGQTQDVLANIAEGAKDGGVVYPRQFGGLEGRRVEPTNAICGGATSGRAIRIDARDERSSIIADACAKKFRALENGDGTAASSGDYACDFIIAEEVMNQGAVAGQSGRLPNVRAGEHVGVVETRGAVVKGMAVWIVKRKGRIAGVKTGDALAKGKIVEAFRVRIVGQYSDAVRHALLSGHLQGMVAGIDIVDVRLDGCRKSVGLESAPLALALPWQDATVPPVASHTVRFARPTFVLPLQGTKDAGSVQGTPAL